MKSTPPKHKVWVQRSKQLATWSQMIFGVVVILALAIFAFLQLDKEAIEGVKTIATSTASLTGVVVTGYMGNSGLEKYTERKCKMEEMLNQESSTTETEEG